MLKKVLIANRGEIAIRVIRACKELGILTVAVYSEADRDALFVHLADEAHCIGPAPASQSYLRIDRIIETTLKAGADAIHPGYGFLAENAEFAAACKTAAIRFVGPPGKVIALMGDKVAARAAMAMAGVPVVPGTDRCVSDPGEAQALAAKIGYPVIIKPAGGGGGIGMAVVSNDRECAEALESTRTIAASTFGVGGVYLEKYLVDPRHIEFQVLVDGKGNSIHLGERECSIQRRHQKLIEESPSVAVTPLQRAQMGDLVARALETAGYEGAGTVEFLLSEGKFYFLEVNARVQVEHPVTEMITGVDIVKEQLRIASGLPLSVAQEQIRTVGSAIECRINAEDPLQDFAPTPGKLQTHHPPGGSGIRVDSGVYAGASITPHYDSLISKLIAWGRDREEAIARMRRALYEYVIEGTHTNIPFHMAMMENVRFLEGKIGTHFIEKETGLVETMQAILEKKRTLAAKLPSAGAPRARIAAIAASAVAARLLHRSKGPIAS